MLNGLVIVHSLDLNHNDINSIEDYAFASLKKMEYLALSDNALDVLSPEIFSGLDSLQRLILTDNPLTTLPTDAFNHLHRPLFIEMSELRLQCDAALCWLKQEELQGTVILEHYQPICANEIQWGNWRCDGVTGNGSQASVFPLSNLQHSNICR